jgi:hypothetical protein
MEGSWKTPHNLEAAGTPKADRPFVGAHHEVEWKMRLSDRLIAEIIRFVDQATKAI